MAKRWYGFFDFIGGGIGALDKYPEAGGPALQDEDMAIGVVSGVTYVYSFNSSSSEVEDVPNVIAPNSGSGRWLLRPLSMMHNDLLGMDGGLASPEGYYHLDAEEYGKRDALDLPVDINRYGFLNRTETTISFDGSSVFTIAGTTWSYYRAGIRHAVTGNKTLTVATPMVDGTKYYIYIDSTDGTLSSATNSWTLNDTKVPVAIIFWNNTLTPKFLICDERHTVQIDRAFHREHHFSDGTEIISAGTLTGLSAGSDTPSTKTFGISDTTFFDEDLYFALAALTDPDGATPTYYNVYRTSTTNYVWAISDMPFKYSGTSAPYGFIEYDDGSGSSTQSTANRFVNTYLFATNVVNNAEANPEIANAPLRYMVVQGRGSYTSAALAIAESFGNFDLTGFPVAEGVAIYQLTWSTTNRPDTVKGRCQFVSAQRITSNITSTVVLAIANHDTLGGLQGGSIGEYFHLTSTQHGYLNDANAQLENLQTDGSPTFAKITTTSDIELGNVSDTTLSRVSAGVVSIEGKNIYVAGGTDVAIADGGTGASTAAEALAALGGIAHSLATAANDFLVASGAGAFVKKTLAETLTILGKGAASGLATLNGSSLVVENPANATSTATASKIPIADGSGKLDTWVSDATTSTKGKLVTAGNAKAIAGTDTASAVTPDDLKYVLDRRIQQYYGVSWDESADTYVRTGSTAGQTCGVTLADAFLPVHRRLRRCVVTDAGEVAYYLSATDSTKKEDGTTSANLDGTDGQVMVEIPKFWYRYGYSGTTHTWEVSPVPLTGFKVHEAFLSDTTEKDYLYVGAYEASLYDVSASLYNGQCYQTAVSAVFEADDNSITIDTRTGWATALAVGQKLVITGCAGGAFNANPLTVTVKTVKAVNAITADEALIDETATVVIQTETDVTDTTGDKLCSVSGVCPITGGSANGTRAHFRTWAENRGGGKAANDAASAQWSQLYGDGLSALQLLYLTEYASFYSQSVLGYGIAAVGDWAAYNDLNPIAKTGNSNGIGNATGNTATSSITTGAAAKDVYLSYRGIENFYGHIWKFIDGYKVNNNIPYLCNNFANFSDAENTTNYTNPTDVNGAAITMHNANGYQGTLELTGRGFFPASITGGDATHKITDYYYQAAGWRVVVSGGHALYAARDGAFYLVANNVLASVFQVYGARLVLRK